MSNNLYMVMSKEIRLEYKTETEPEVWDRIYAWVIARNPSQAQYLAWKEEVGKSNIGNILEKPNFQYRTILKNVPFLHGIVETDNFMYCPIKIKPFTF